MKRFVCRSILLAGLLFSAAGSAQVYRSDSGLGGALILPYWTVAAGNDTLIGVSNDSTRATALKFRLLDEEGELLSHFSLYLDARSQWGGALARIDGQTLLLPSEVGCMLPAPSASHNGRPALTLDAPRGTVEIIEMGSVGDDLDLVNGGRWTDCDALADGFNTGLWADDPNTDFEPPTQKINAQATLINVAAGGMNTVPATAMGNFSDIAQHTAPASELPDLAHAFDSGSANGGVRGRVCVEGNCRIDEWERPIEAVSAVLMVSTKMVGYSVDPDLAAEFEWVVHRPLKRYEDVVDGFTIGSRPLMEVRNSRGDRRYIFTNCVIPNDLCLITRQLIPTHAVLQSLPFNTVFQSDATTVESSILGHPVVIFRVFALGGMGSNNLVFKGGTAEIDSAIGSVGSVYGDSLTATDGTRFLGEPLVSFAIQQFSNGTLTDHQGQNVLSNYRRTELPRQILLLQAPE